MRHFAARGPLDRTTALRSVFSDVLADEVLARRSKATFNEAFISDHSREFAAHWTGSGVDEQLVNPDRLTEEWRSERPDARSLLLMQAAWLAGS